MNTHAQGTYSGIRRYQTTEVQVGMHHKMHILLIDLSTYFWIIRCYFFLFLPTPITHLNLMRLLFHFIFFLLYMLPSVFFLTTKCYAIGVDMIAYHVVHTCYGPE